MLNSERKILETKVKDFVAMELNDAKIKKEFASANRSQAFGVVFFACNELFDIYNSDLADWWDKEMLPQFNELIRGC